MKGAKAIFVTHKGPCWVNEELYQQIRDRMGEDENFAGHILFWIAFPPSWKYVVNTVYKEVRKVETMQEFVGKYIIGEDKRNLLI